MKFPSILTLLWLAAASLYADEPAVYFEQDIDDSNGLRVQQSDEIDHYITQQAASQWRFQHLFMPNYESEAAFTESAEAYRKAFAQSIGYPPPGLKSNAEGTLTLLGEDTIATYYRLVVAVTEEINVEGIYLTPKGATGQVPLIISMHGGGGSPERALFHGGANYHDMVRGGVKRGYAVFAPQHLFSSEGLAKDVRQSADLRLRMVGTSLTAIEIAKITRSLDYLTTRPEIDASRLAMLGLSYGGYYTLVTMALERRIRVGVSSGYFGVQEGRYAREELSVPTDFQFTDRFTLFRDADLINLICPRPLLLQAGEADDVDHREPGRAAAEHAAEPYKKLGIEERFQHFVFPGGHEFHDDSAWNFVGEHLPKPR